MVSAFEALDLEVVCLRRDPLSKTESLYMLNQREFNTETWLADEGKTDAKGDGRATQGLARAGNCHCPGLRMCGGGRKHGAPDLGELVFCGGVEVGWGQKGVKKHCQEHHWKLR